MKQHRIDGMVYNIFIELISFIEANKEISSCFTYPTSTSSTTYPHGLLNRCLDKNMQILNFFYGQ